MNRLACAVLVIALAACGDTTTHITIETVEPPKLVAFRNESSQQWQSLATAGTSTFKVTATGPYRVVIVCDTSTLGTIIAEFARTPDGDEPTIRYSCQSHALRVTGQMQQPGSVAVGNTTAINASTASPWNFTVPVSTGTFDIVMLFRDPAGAPLIAIRRDVAISGDTNLGPIDPASENAQALAPASFDASGIEPDELRSATVTLYTANTTALLTSLAAPNTWDAALVPDAILRSGDRQNISLNATRTTSSLSRFRLARRDVRVGDTTSLTLPPPIGGAQFEMTAARLSVTFSSSPDYDRLSLVRLGRSTGTGGQITISQTATFSRSFLDATGATGPVLELDDVPGYQPEWRLDPAFPQSRQLAVIRGTSTADSTTAGLSQSNVMVQGRQAPDAPLGDTTAAAAAAAAAAAFEPTTFIADDAILFAPLDGTY